MSESGQSLKHRFEELKEHRSATVLFEFLLALPSRFSRTVRYELRVLVGFKRAHRGRPKVYTGPAVTGVLVRFSKELQWFERHRFV